MIREYSANTIGCPSARFMFTEILVSDSTIAVRTVVVLSTLICLILIDLTLAF